MLRPYNPALDAEPFAVQQVADVGVNPFDIGEAVAAIESAATELNRIK